MKQKITLNLPIIFFLVLIGLLANCKSTTRNELLNPTIALKTPAFQKSPKTTKQLGDFFQAKGHTFASATSASPELLSEVLIDRLPRDFKDAELKQWREVFLLTLVPLVQYANWEISQEQQVLDRLATASPKERQSENYQLWLNHFKNRYNSTDLIDLKARIQPTPSSLVIAQAILESDWGRSRFAQQGQALFGVHAVKGQPGIKALRSEVRVASYLSLLDSVRSYMILLNTGKTFAKFRQQRIKFAGNQDLSVILTKALHGYSEIGQTYGRRLRRVMDKNQLKGFD